METDILFETTLCHILILVDVDKGSINMLKKTWNMLFQLRHKIKNTNVFSHILRQSPVFVCLCLESVYTYI